MALTTVQSQLVGQVIQTKTTTYTMLVSDDLVLASTASAWTLTIPTAVGNSGKILKIKKTSSDLNALTISPAAGTIDGSATTTINTQYEILQLISDGTNWFISSRDYPRAWVAWTPAFIGLGTVTNIQFFSRRAGDSLEVMGSASTGTATAVTSQMTIGYNGVDAVGLVIGTVGNAGPGALVGTCIVYTATTQQTTVLINPGITTYVSFGIKDAANSGLSAVNATVAFPQNGQAFSLYFKVPIATWK